MTTQPPLTLISVAPGLNLPPQPPCGVAIAIAAVMGEMPAIGKDQKAAPGMGGYAYRGIEDMTRALQPILAKHGVVIVPKCRITKVELAPANQNKAMQDVYVEVDWVIYGPDGSFIEATTSGIGRDHTDKGANKAQTQAYKYLLMHMLCVSDSHDDGDGTDFESLPPYEDPKPRLIAALMEDLGKLNDESKAAIKALSKQHGDKKLTERSFADNDDWFQTVSDEVAVLLNSQIPEHASTPLADIDRENSEHNQKAD